MMTKVKQEFLT